MCNNYNLPCNHTNYKDNLRQTLLVTSDDWQQQLRRLNEHIYALKTTTKYNEYGVNIKSLDKKYRDQKVKVVKEAEHNKSNAQKIVEKISARLKAINETDYEDTIMLEENIEGLNENLNNKGVNLKKNG